MKITRWQCEECEIVIEVKGTPEEVTSVLDAEAGFFKCPTCDGPLRRAPMTLFQTEDLGRHPDRFESAKEFWQFGTVGPEEERPSTEEDVDGVVRALLTQRITSVKARHREGRCIIECICLDDGTELWFAASGLGASISRMAKGKEKEDACRRTDR